MTEAKQRQPRPTDPNVLEQAKASACAAASVAVPMRRNSPAYKAARMARIEQLCPVLMTQEEAGARGITEPAALRKVGLKNETS